VETLFYLDTKSEKYGLDLLSLVESILENPRALLFRQLDKIKGDRIAEMKAQGMDYEQRMEELEKVTYPKPIAEFIYETFNAFADAHPWVAGENIHPKSIARDMFERYATFGEYVRLYGMQRSEGLLLRYITQTYGTLVRTVPEASRNDQVLEIISYLRTILEHVDASLLRQWEAMVERAEEIEDLKAPPKPVDITLDRRAFFARIRAELHQLVKALAVGDYEEAAASIRQPADTDSPEYWRDTRLIDTMNRFYAEHEQLIFDHRARLSEYTHIKEVAPRVWEVQQTLLDSDEENLWAIGALVDMSDPEEMEGPLLRLQRISP